MDQLFITINSWISSGTLIAALGCFLWGMVSIIFSPCHLASIPLIIGYVGGQHDVVEGKKGAIYAVLFTLGLFITIAVIGIITAMLGRLMGDIGIWWSIPVGLILIWVSLDMLGLARCSLSGSLFGSLNVTGFSGAFILGLAYGVLSGSCTFGFIAPILAIISAQEQVFTGTILIILFGVGHCLPIALAGSSTAVLQKLMANNAWQRSSLFFHKFAGIIVGCLGVYFALQPFFS